MDIARGDRVSDFVLGYFRVFLFIKSRRIADAELVWISMLLGLAWWVIYLISCIPGGKWMELRLSKASMLVQWRFIG